MAYLTIFTLPKPFTDPHVRTIQSNALASWMRLGDQVEVLVIGDDPGVAEAAEHHQVRHLGGVELNDYGTPLLDWAFREAAVQGSGELICYLNSDIILGQDFLDALRRLPTQPALAIGQRWNCDIDRLLEFNSDVSSLQEWARRHGELDQRRGSDYFAYPRHTDFGMPSFAVGRPGWDNWLIGRALEIGLPVVDITPCVTVIHQSHDYRHVANDSRGADWEGPEADRNRALAGTLDRYVHTPANATHVLTQRGLRRAVTAAHLRAKTEAFVSLNPRATALRRLVKLVRRVYPARPPA